MTRKCTCGGELLELAARAVLTCLQCGALVHANGYTIRVGGLRIRVADVLRDAIERGVTAGFEDDDATCQADREIAIVEAVHRAVTGVFDVEDGG